MSTRCTIHFENQAIIYRHHDGYPEGEAGVPACLKKFFEAVEAQTQDRRFHDPSYLAAKYVVWQAGEYTKDFLGVGVVLTDPGDIAYRYHVKGSEDGHPKVTWEKV